MPTTSKPSKSLLRLASRRHAVPRVVVDAAVAGLGSVFDRKEALVADLAGVSSLRDFGGCYLVEGRYLLEPARALGADFVSMVDHGDTTQYEQRAAALAVELPTTRFETVNHDFRDPSMFESLERVDASILFEVLLHQENYIEVVRNVTRTTTRFVCVAQPCLREDCFALPASATLLQFWDEDLKNELREGSFWPVEPKMTRFESAAWMWGHTTSHLIDLFGGFGWTLDSGEVLDGVCGVYWEYPLLVFRAPG